MGVGAPIILTFPRGLFDCTLSRKPLTELTSSMSVEPSIWIDLASASSIALDGIASESLTEARHPATVRSRRGDPWSRNFERVLSLIIILQPATHGYTNLYAADLH